MDTDLSKLDDEKLVHAELALERRLMEASFRHKTRQLEDTSVLRKLRRDIARARTLQRQRELAQGMTTDALRSKYRGSFDPAAAATGSASSASSASGFLKGLVDKVSKSE